MFLETSVDFSQTTRLYIPERILQSLKGTNYLTEVYRDFSQPVRQGALPIEFFSNSLLDSYSPCQ
jgi:hypothetical protein